MCCREASLRLEEDCGWTRRPLVRCYGTVAMAASTVMPHIVDLDTLFQRLIGDIRGRDPAISIWRDELPMKEAVSHDGTRDI